MEGLFNLLQETPLLLFFIIAAIISFIQGRGGNKKEDKQQSREQGQQQRPVSKRKELEVDWKEIFRQEEEPKQQPTQSRSGYDQRSKPSVPTVSDAKEEFTKANRQFQEKYEKIQERKNSIREENEIGTTPIGSSATNSRKSRVRLNFSRITRDDAVKGVIWSEILGKPVSRRK